MKSFILKSLLLYLVFSFISCDPPKVREVKIFDHTAKVPQTYKFNTVTVQACKVARNDQFIYQLNNGIFIETSMALLPGQKLSLQPLKNNRDEKNRSSSSE